jgi:hypothetical protein
MGRRRAAESVPAVEDGIEEVVIKHTKTRRGVRTTEKVVPVVIPSKEKPGQSSRSKKGKQRQLDPEQVEESEGHPLNIEDTQTEHFFDEQVDDFLTLAPEQGQSQANVCTGLHLLERKF